MKTTFNTTITIDIDIQNTADIIEDLVFEIIKEQLLSDGTNGCAGAFFPAIMTSVTEELMSRHMERGAD